MFTFQFFNDKIHNYVKKTPQIFRTLVISSAGKIVFIRSVQRLIVLVLQLIIYLTFSVNYLTVNLLFYEFSGGFQITVLNNQLYRHFLYCFDLN